MLIEVTEADIREGVAEDCDCCPVALAIHRVTGEDGRVFSLDWELRLAIGPISIPAPWEVRKFVHAFDERGRHKNGKPILVGRLPEELSPFSFEVPEYESTEWEEQCHGCEYAFKQSLLDDEGYCPECVSKYKTMGDSAGKREG